MNSLTINATPTPDNVTALQEAELLGQRAVLLDGRPHRISEADAHRLERAGAEFAYLGWLKTGRRDEPARIVTTPVGG